MADVKGNNVAEALRQALEHLEKGVSSARASTDLEVQFQDRSTRFQGLPEATPLEALRRALEDLEKDVSSTRVSTNLENQVQDLAERLQALSMSVSQQVEFSRVTKLDEEETRPSSESSSEPYKNLYATLGGREGVEELADRSQVFGRLGPAAAAQADALAERLWDEEERVQVAAAEAFGSLGPEISAPHITALARLLHDDRHWRGRAGSAEAQLLRKPKEDQEDQDEEEPKAHRSTTDT